MARQHADWYKHPQLASKGKTHHLDAAEPWREKKHNSFKLFPKSIDYLPYYYLQLKNKNYTYNPD